MINKLNVNINPRAGNEEKISHNLLKKTQIKNIDIDKTKEPGTSLKNIKENAFGQKLGANISKDELEMAVKEIEKGLSSINEMITIRFDKESNTNVMEIIDRNTGEVLRQVPPKEILRIKEAFQKKDNGFFLNKIA